MPCRSDVARAGQRIGHVWPSEATHDLATAQRCQRLWRPLGGALLALSFFLPLGYHSPGEEFLATVDSLTSAESAGEFVVAGGLLIVIAYSYIWAVLVALAALWNFAGKRRR